MTIEISKIIKEKNRLSTKMSLIFVLCSLAIGIILFTLAYLGMRQNIGLGQYNQPVLDWMLNHRAESITTIAKFVTNIASPFYLAILTAVIIIGWIAIKREIWRPILLGLSVAVSATASYVLKLMIMDARPPITNMVPAFELDYSFPSGHTISIVVLLLILGYLIYSRHFSFPRLMVWGLVTIAMGSLIGLSRLYLGYHWLTDVIASAGLGFIILAVFISIDIFVTRKFLD